MWCLWSVVVLLSAADVIGAVAIVGVLAAVVAVADDVLVVLFS